MQHLLDHLVGACEQHRRHVEAERPGSRYIDDELERDRAHNRQIDGFGTLENAPGIGAELPEDLGEADPVRRQSPLFPPWAIGANVGPAARVPRSAPP